MLVTFKLADAFTDEIRAAIHSGLTISFVYRVDLKRSSALWFDSTIASTEITATVRYDNLTRVYHVTRMQDGRIERAETTEREEDARAWLTAEFDKLPLFSSAALEANSEYVRPRAGPHDAAQRLVRLAVGAPRRHRAGEVHLRSIRASARPRHDDMFATRGARRFRPGNRRRRLPPSAGPFATTRG